MEKARADSIPASGASHTGGHQLTGRDVAATNGTITTLSLSAKPGTGGQLGDLLVSELDIDTSTGQIVGIREIHPHRSTSLVPAGVPWVSWRIDVTVVDRAPAP